MTDQNFQNSVKYRIIFSQNARNDISETPDLTISWGSMPPGPIATSRAFGARYFHSSFHKLATPLLSSRNLYFYKYIFSTLSYSWERLMYNAQVSWFIHIVWNRPVFLQSVILHLL